MNGHITAADLAAKLNGRRSGLGYSARCPAHEDRISSLSIRQGKRGTMLHCHAGCRTNEICQALGISMAQLFEDYGQNGNHPTNTDIDQLLRSTVRKLEGRKPPDELRTLAEIMDLAFHAKNHNECMARAREQHGSLMELEFQQAMSMSVILADTAVYAYLEDYFEPDRMNWHEVKRKALTSLDAAWRKETR